MPSIEYNVTVELKETDPDAVADRVFTDPPYSAAVGTAPEGHVSVTVTLRADYLEAAVDTVMLVARHLWELTPYAVTALPTEAFDRRELAEDAGMLSVPQAAERLGVSEQRVRQLLAAVPPKLAGEKVGRDWLVSAASVAERMGQQ